MQRSAIIWVILLILVGGLFLMDGLGYFIVNFWKILLPLTLVGAGLYIVLHGFGRDEPPSVEHLTMELKGAETADIHFICHGGSLVVSGDGPPSDLLSGTFVGGVEYKASDMGDSKVQLDLRTLDSHADPESRDWRVSLNPDLPLAIRFIAMNCEVAASLGDMQVHELTIEAQASDVDIALPAAAGSVKVSVVESQSYIVLRIPEGVAASILGTAVSDESVPDKLRFIPTGGRLESTGYETAGNRVEIVAEGAPGRVLIL